MKLYAAAATVALLLATIQTTPAAAEEQEQENTDSAPENKDEAISEPPIKLVHVLNPGEREYLSPNLIGVQNIAMTFLPLSMNFVNIIDAYREIVNGVQYEILLNAVDTKAKDADTVCRLVILEKPWQTTQWGDKYRELVNSNCSDAADNALSPESEERSKALNDKYVSNSIFNGGRRNELSDSEMARLESQILTIGPNDKRRVSSISSSPSSSNGASTTSTTTISSAEPTNEPTTSISVDEAATVPFESDIVDGTTPTATPTSTLPTAELNDNEKRWLDDFLSVGAYNFEKTIEQQRLELKQQQEKQEQEKQQQEEQQQEHQQEEEQVQDHKEASSS